MAQTRKHEWVQWAKWPLLVCLVSWGLLAMGQHQGIPALWSQLRVVADPHAHFLPAQAWTQSQSPAATYLTQPNQVLGQANSPPHWAAWSVHFNPTDAQVWWLILQSPTQDHSALWVKRDEGAWQAQAELGSDDAPWGHGHLLPMWVLDSQGAKRMDVMLRTEGPNRVQFPLRMETPAAFMAHHQRLMLVMGAVLAVPLLVMFYAVSLVRRLKSLKLHLFLGMALCELVAAAWISGLLNLLWPAWTRSQTAWLGTAAYWLLFVFSLHHARAFLRTAQNHPHIHHGLGWAALAWWCVVPVCALFAPTGLRTLLLYGGSLHASGMVVLAWRCWREQPSAARALFGGVWLVYLSSMAVYWAYRWWEWPLFITLGVQFVQGALVSTLLGLSVCVQVIAERQALRQSNTLSQARHRWYAAAHHDLWQPLQSIQLYANALMTASASQRPGLVNGMRLATASVDDFMNQLRDWSNETPDGMSKQPPVVQVNLADLLSPLVEEFRPLASMRHVVLRSHCPAIEVMAHPPAVQRMVRNLLSNALQYTPAGGRVLLGVRRAGPWAWVLCWDNGIGMSEAQAQVCFEAFTRADVDRGSAHHLGLGLFSVKQLAARHRLPTRLQSELGKGTVVGFGLPLLPR